MRGRPLPSRPPRPHKPASGVSWWACAIAVHIAALFATGACSPPPPPGNETAREAGPVPESARTESARTEPVSTERASTEPAPIEHIVPEGVARLPVFTPAVGVGDLVFLSGAIGTPRSGELRVVEGGVGPETRATMENIRRILDAAGLGFADLVKCTVFLADIADYAAMNEVYVTYFEGIEPPARSAMAGSGLALGARVEIECIARR